MEKITLDLLTCIPRSKNAAINKSIITSLGFLRCKNVDVLDAFCDTFFTKSMDYSVMDYSSILQTFAALQHKSEKANSFIEVKDFIMFLYLKHLKLFWKKFCFF